MLILPYSLTLHWLSFPFGPSFLLETFFLFLTFRSVFSPCISFFSNLPSLLFCFLDRYYLFLSFAQSTLFGLVFNEILTPCSSLKLQKVFPLCPSLTLNLVYLCFSYLILPSMSFSLAQSSLNVLQLPSMSFVYPQRPSFTLNVLRLPSIFSRCPSFYSILPPCPALTLMMNVFIVREIRLEIAQRTVKYLCSLI